MRKLTTDRPYLGPIRYDTIIKRALEN